MKEAITNLTKQQSLRLQQLLAEHNIDAKTSSKTQKYYREMRKMHHYFDQHPYNLEDLMRASILVAQKSQVVYTLSGQRIRGLGLSLNGMVKEGVSMNKMVGIIRLFMTYNKMIDEELREDLVEVVGEIVFGTNFIEKFERAIAYFDFEEYVSQSYGYSRLFTSFSWLFFLRLQSRLAIKSQVQSDYLLISVLYLMVRYAFDYMRPKNTPTSVNRSNSKVLITSILQKLFQIFLIDDPVSFKRITAMVDQHFEELIESQTLKCHDCQNYDFLSPTLIALNYKKIDMLYQRERNPSSIDYRLFLLNRQSTLTPTKDTNAISRAGTKESKKRELKPRSFASHKILTFDMEQGGQSSQSSARNYDIKLPANVKVSPSYIKTPLICAQQQSPGSLLQHFLRRQIKCNRNKLQILQNEQEIIELIKSVLEGYGFNAAKLKQHVLLTYNYYLVISTRFFNSQLHDQTDFNGLHCAFLLHSMQLIIYSSVQSSQQGGNEIRPIFQHIRKYITTNGIDLWVANDFLQRDSSRVPPPFKELLISMQSMIVNELVWQDEGFIAQVQSLSSDFSASIHRGYVLRLLNLTLGQIRTQISQLLVNFNLLDRQQIESDVYRTVKYMMVVTPQAIQGMHLHQIMLSSIYLTLRTRSITLKFNDIINHYQQINAIKSGEFKVIINQITVGEGTQPGRINIIEYYNKYFVPFIKHHLESVRLMSFDMMAEPFRRNMHETEDNNKIKTFGGISKSGWKSKPRMSNRKTYTQQSQPQESRMKKSYTQKHQEEKQLREVLREETNQERKSTTMRTRPAGSLLNMLKTQKIKSPPYQ